MSVHRVGVAPRQNEAYGLALGRTDGAEDVGPLGALVVRRAGAGSPLAQRRVILFFWPILASSWNHSSIFTSGLRRVQIASISVGKFKSLHRELVLGVMVRPRRQLAEAHGLEYRLTVVSSSETENSSDSHCTRSINRQRTTPWIAGIGPASTISLSARRCFLLNLGVGPGALMLISPSGPWLLNRNTQSRMLYSVTPPGSAASLREPPS